MTEESGIRPRTILAPVLAWLAAASVLAIYLNQRGHWRALEGDAAYRDCFGSAPPDSVRVIRAASLRRYRYTGEMLAMECYVRAEGGFEGTAEGAQRVVSGVNGGVGAARIAIVGTGAWGTTMSVLLGAREPVTLLARRPEKAARIQADRVNDENLPGIALPTGSRPVMVCGSASRKCSCPRR